MLTQMLFINMARAVIFRWMESDIEYLDWQVKVVFIWNITFTVHSITTFSPLPWKVLLLLQVLTDIMKLTTYIHILLLIHECNTDICFQSQNYIFVGYYLDFKLKWNIKNRENNTHVSFSTNTIMLAYKAGAVYFQLKWNWTFCTWFD